MAKKLSSEERRAWEKDLATLRAAVAQCESVLQADDKEAAKSVQRSDVGIVKEFAEAAPGRQGTVLGVLAAREFGRRGGPQS